jgi:hypothetical protein
LKARERHFPWYLRRVALSLYTPDLNPPDDLSAAEAFYAAVRAQDDRLRRVEDDVITWVRELTGYTAEDVGSFGLKLNLSDSGLDLAVGVPAEDLARVLELLSREMSFKGERQTTPVSTRHVFFTRRDGVDIDLGVLPLADLQVLSPALATCREQMTHQERVLHVWEKRWLKAVGRKEDYAALKLAPY